MSDNRRVMFVVPYLKVGGQERQLYYLATELQQRGYEVAIVVCERTGQFIATYDEGGLKPVFLDVPFTKGNAIRLIWRLRKVMRKIQPDVVISRSWNTNLLVALTSAAANTKFILFVTGSHSHNRDYGIIGRTVRKSLMGRASRIICVSEGSRTSFQRTFSIAPSKVCVIHNGVDVELVSRLSKLDEEHESSTTSECINLVFVGRLDPRKGLDILLTALKEVQREAPTLFKQLSLTIVGGGQRELYEALCQRLSLCNTVRFVGEQPNPYGYMSRSDIFILPSRREGFPNVLLEAMSLGVASIASDCQSGPNEVIEHGVNGWLVQPEEIRDLSAAIIKLGQDATLRRQLGERARQSILEKFTIDAKVNEISDLIGGI